MTRSSHVRHICAGTGCPRQPLSPVADSLSAGTDRLAITQVRERARCRRGGALTLTASEVRAAAVHATAHAGPLALVCTMRCGDTMPLWDSMPRLDIAAVGFCAAKGLWDARCADMMCAEAMHNQPVHVFNLEAPLPVFGPTAPPQQHPAAAHQNALPLRPAPT